MWKSSSIRNCDTNSMRIAPTHLGNAADIRRLKRVNQHEKTLITQLRCSSKKQGKLAWENFVILVHWLVCCVTFLTLVVTIIIVTASKSLNRWAWLIMSHFDIRIFQPSGWGGDTRCVRIRGSTACITMQLHTPWNFFKHNISPIRDWPLTLDHYVMYRDKINAVQRGKII